MFTATVTSHVCSSPQDLLARNSQLVKMPVRDTASIADHWAEVVDYCEDNNLSQYTVEWVRTYSELSPEISAKVASSLKSGNLYYAGRVIFTSEDFGGDRFLLLLGFFLAEELVPN